MGPDEWAALLAPKSPEDPYYAELGRFITEFSSTEFAVRDCLRSLLGTTPGEAAALFHKWSLSECIAAINRLLSARGDTAMADRMHEGFTQLQAIAEIQNALVHWSSTLDLDDGFILENRHRAHRDDKKVEYRVPVSQLTSMSIDLLKVKLHIAWGFRHDSMSKAMRTRVSTEVVSAPWLYKRP
jgi:hypothetical protein